MTLRRCWPPVRSTRPFSRARRRRLFSRSVHCGRAQAGIPGGNQTAAIAHDLRNLLTTLERCLRELQRPAENDVMESCRTINTLSTFLLELTEELQAAGHSGLALTIVDLEDTVEVAAVTVYPSAADRRQRLVIDIEEAARHVRADATKLKRVMSNLLAHASRESPPLGTVTVSARREVDACVISVSYTTQTASLSRMSELFNRR